MKFVKLLATGIITLSSASFAQDLTNDLENNITPEEALLNLRTLYYGKKINNNKEQVNKLLPIAMQSPLGKWALYWVYRADLNNLNLENVYYFERQYPNTYLEDRLRNDWLLQAGKNRDWYNFLKEYPKFRMKDDASVRCYALAAEIETGKITPANIPADRLNTAFSDWAHLNNVDEGCNYLAGQLIQNNIWKDKHAFIKARIAARKGKKNIAAAALSAINENYASVINTIWVNPQKYIDSISNINQLTQIDKEFLILAIMRLAVNNTPKAIEYARSIFAGQLDDDAKNTIYAQAGLTAFLNGEPLAIDYYKLAKKPNWADEIKIIMARSALRSGRWQELLNTINTLKNKNADNNAWIYWRGYSNKELGNIEKANQDFNQIINNPSGWGFYEKLAAAQISSAAYPNAPAKPSKEEMDYIKSISGLNLALQAIKMNMRSEGVRMWNYWTRLHNGGMNQRQLYAAANYACDNKAWDICINTANKIKTFTDIALINPQPFKYEIENALKTSGGLNINIINGLIKQESRFVSVAKSPVGASGLMQLMPATARWTAKKMQLENFNLSQVLLPETNIKLGTFYLTNAWVDFDYQLPLALAAYNAGPGRARRWREWINTHSNDNKMLAARWIETIPFQETRNYVKYVLSSMVDYEYLNGNRNAILKIDDIVPKAADAIDLSVELP